MARAKEFRRELNKLFSRRVAWLSGLLEKPRRGAILGLRKAHVQGTIAKLQELVSAALSRDLAKKEFEHGVNGGRNWRVNSGKGWTYRDRKKAFKRWFEENIFRKTCIYVIWKRRKCMYVGKTTTGGGRIASHFEKRWFSGVTQVSVYETRGKRYLPALECIAIHRFQPNVNRFKAESRKWTRKCPLCEIHKGIDAELRHIFRLR